MEQITLKGARVSAGYTLREVGLKINRSFQTVAKYEKDSTKIPIDLLRELTSLYNISPDLIFLGKVRKKTNLFRKERPNGTNLYGRQKRAVHHKQDNR